MLKTFLRPPRCLLISEMWTGLKRAADAGRCNAYMYAHVFISPLKRGLNRIPFIPVTFFILSLLMLFALHFTHPIWKL